MNKLTWIAMIMSLAALLVAVGSWIDARQQSKVGYIELVKVFNGFEMTQQYKKKLEAVLMNRKAITDSMELNLRALSRSMNTSGKPDARKMAGFEYERQLYAEKAQRFEEDNQALKQQYDGEINKQLNQYIKEYGEKHSYRYIYGADGSGVLMYAKEGDNLSEDVMKYINERYKGHAK